MVHAVLAHTTEVCVRVLEVSSNRLVAASVGLNTWN